MNNARHTYSSRRRRIAVVSALAICAALLTSCASTPTAPVDASTSAPETKPSFDPNTYPQPDKYGADQLAALADEQDARQIISMSERYPGFTRPAVTRQRFVLKPEGPDVWAQCLTDSGHPSTAVDGGVSNDLPTGELDNEPWDTAYTACILQHPTDPRYSIPPNEDQLTFLHQYYVHVATPCLEQFGETVSPAPTLSTFVANWGTDSSWLPHWGISLQTRTDTAEQCPQIPAGFYGPEIASAEQSLKIDNPTQ